MRETPLSGPDDPRYNNPKDWRYADNHPEEGSRQFIAAIFILAVFVWIICQILGWHVRGLL